MAGGDTLDAPVIKTRSEQLVEWFDRVRLERPLTETEQREHQRAMHAVDVRNWRLAKAMDEATAGALSEHDRLEADTLRKVEREAHR